MYGKLSKILFPYQLKKVNHTGNIFTIYCKLVITFDLPNVLIDFLTFFVVDCLFYIF